MRLQTMVCSYVSMYVCMYVSCMHACISKLQTVRWNTPSNNGVYVCLFGPCIYVCTTIWKHWFVCMYICMYVCILNVCIYVSDCNLISFLLTDANCDNNMETMVSMFVYMYVCTKMYSFGSCPFNGCPLWQEYGLESTGKRWLLESASREKSWS